MEGLQVLGPNHRTNGVNGTVFLNGTANGWEEVMVQPEWYAA